MGSQFYVNGKVVLVDRIISNGYVCVTDGVIVEIGQGTPRGISRNHKVIDLSGKWLIPGFIDVHVHGGDGASFMSEDTDQLERIVEFHARHGTTSLLATTSTASVEKLTSVIRHLSEFVRNQKASGSRVVGIHIEGPFISPKRKGAQDPRYIIEPNLEIVEQWVRDARGTIRLMTVAPELPGALGLIRLLHEFGITVGAGHTDARYEELLEAIRCGVTHSIHTFNGMRPFHHRDPGVLAAVLNDERVICEIVCDGHHVHPGAIRLMYNAKGANGIALITDAVDVAGLPEGEYQWSGRAVRLQDGRVELADGSSLAGSVLTMDQAYKNCLSFLPVTMVEASLMASTNPAKSIGIDNRKGKIAIGMDADLVVMDEDLNVVMTIVEGQQVYNREKNS